MGMPVIWAAGILVRSKTIKMDNFMVLDMLPRVISALLSIAS